MPSRTIRSTGLSSPATFAMTCAATSSTRRTPPGSDPLRVQSARAVAKARLKRARCAATARSIAAYAPVSSVSSSPPARRSRAQFDEGHLVPVELGEKGERADDGLLGRGEPPRQPQGHAGPLQTAPVGVLDGQGVLCHAVEGGLAGGRTRGCPPCPTIRVPDRLGQCPRESAQAAIPGQGCPAAEMGHGGGLDQLEQRIGPAELRPGRVGVVAPQVVEGVGGGMGQHAPDLRLDGPIEEEPLEPGGRGLDGGLAGRLLGEDDLAGDRHRQRVAGRAGLDDVEDRPRRRAEHRDQPAPRGPAQVFRGLEVADRRGRRRPSQQPRQVRLAILQAQCMVQDRRPGRAGVQHAGRDRVVIAIRRIRLQQGAGQASSRRAGSSWRARNSRLTPSHGSSRRSLPRASRATTSWPSSD